MVNAILVALQAGLLVQELFCYTAFSHLDSLCEEPITKQCDIRNGELMINGIETW